MIDQTFVALLSSGILGLITFFGFIFRKISRDKLQVSRDRAEGNLIADLIKQRDDARKERDQMQVQLVKIGQEAQQCMQRVRELLTKEQQLRIQNSMLSNLLERLAEALDQSKVQLQQAMQDDQED